MAESKKYTFAGILPNPRLPLLPENELKYGNQAIRAKG